MNGAPGLALTVGVPRESAPRERRVALDPAACRRLVTQGRAVLVESGAGLEARFADADYTAAGAEVRDRASVVAGSAVLAVVAAPDDDLVGALRSGQLLIGLVDPAGHPATMAALAARGVTVVAFEHVPRTLGRAQAMDALTSQASTAGYRAGILAAASYESYFPMMITASGTARPASVIVLGTGVAGLQAIATAQRLGAVVTGYDVRPASRGEVESLGATFLTSASTQEAGADGYARSSSAEEARRQQDELGRHLVDFDVVIATAKVPGRTPPLLVTEDTLAAMRPGSVCLDLAATDQQGNVTGSVSGRRTTTAGGVVVLGAGDLSSDLARSSSQMYAHNVTALLDTFVADGVLRVDPDDEVHRAVVVCHDGATLRPTTPVLTGATS